MDTRTRRNDEPIDEIAALRRRIAELEQAAAKQSQAEETLRDTQGIFKQFLENSPVHIFVKDDRGRSLILSRNYETLLGRPIRDMIGKTMFDLFPSELANRMIEDDLQVLHGGKKITVEEELDGRHYLTTKFPIHSKGKPVYLAGFTADITAYKQALADLAKNEARLRTIFQICPVPLNINRLEDGRCILINRAFTRATGYTEADLLGKTWTECSIWANSGDRKRFLDELGKEGEIHEFEAAFRTKEGRTLYGLASAALIDVDGVSHSVNITRDITRRKQTEDRLRDSLRQLRRAVETTFQVLGVALGMKDPYTAGHQRRAADLARTIATEMRLPADQIESLRMAGVIHDIGKIALPTEILTKAGRLSEAEFNLIKGHAQLGYDILKDVDSPWPLAEIVYQHHERLDGSGYPRRLKGDGILIEARILAVADVVESMASHRPYRPARGIEAALAEIEKNMGILYDPDVADACLRIFRERGYELKSY